MTSYSSPAQEVADLQAKIKSVAALGEQSEVHAVRILNRHHFSSALQRMSTVARISLRSGKQATHLSSPLSNA